MHKVFILGAAAVGVAIAYRSFSRAPRPGVGAAFGRRVLRHMARLLAMLPENAPPKLVMSILPRVREQNDQIIAMLGEQNVLLRELRKEPH